MKNNSGNPNLPIKSDNKLPNIAQTNQLIQHAKVNDKALSNILNSRDPEYWLKKVREALDKKAWTEAVFYGQKALFYDANFVKADIVLAYSFGRLRDINNSMFHIERVDRFEEIEAEVYRSLLSTLELYFLSVLYNIFYQYQITSNKLEEIVQPLKLKLSKVTYEELKTILIDNPNIHFLQIEHYEEEILPKEILQLTNLTELNLWCHQLISLPKEIGQLANLTFLNFSGSSNLNLKKIFSTLKNLPNLISLDLEGNQLTSLPEEIGQLINLDKLNLICNDLTSLPEEIGQLINLDELHLISNNLRSLPKEIGQLTNLTSLVLVFNKLTSLPKEIGQLTNLTSLNLMNNNFSESEKQKIKNLLPNCRVRF